MRNVSSPEFSLLIRIRFGFRVCPNTRRGLLVGVSQLRKGSRGQPDIRGLDYLMPPMKWNVPQDGGHERADGGGTDMLRSNPGWQGRQSRQRESAKTPVPRGIQQN